MIRPYKNFIGPCHSKKYCPIPVRITGIVPRTSNLLIISRCFELFKKYQLERHTGGSMSDMDEDEFTSMIETSPIKTSLLEFRDKSKNLAGVVLLDIDKKNLSAVYSFFDPKFNKFGLGNYMIMQCFLYGKIKKYKYLYLGYYIEELSSMSYKSRFKPGQILKNNEWENF